MWMSRVRALAVTIVSAVGGLFIPTAYAHADLYDYKFTSSSYSTNIIGTFEAN